MFFYFFFFVFGNIFFVLGVQISGYVFLFLFIYFHFLYSAIHFLYWRSKFQDIFFNFFYLAIPFLSWRSKFQDMFVFFFSHLFIYYISMFLMFFIFFVLGNTFCIGGPIFRICFLFLILCFFVFFCIGQYVLCFGGSKFQDIYVFYKRASFLFLFFVLGNTFFVLWAQISGYVFYS